MIRGFCLGKFMPPHLGHFRMLEFASGHCDMLTILVCSLDSEPIPGELRYKWVKHNFPHARVLWCHENDLPQEPKDENDEAFWDIWRDVLRRYHPERIDRVFGSEDYINRLAKEAGNAEPFIFDKERKTVPISGTAIRTNPWGHWSYIPDIVRPYFNKRVLITGPESCGKTTIAKELAAIFQTTWTPEYAREYIEEYMDNDMANLTAEHMRTFLHRHSEQEQYAWLNANKVTFSDTSAIETYIYAKTMLGEEEAKKVNAEAFMDKNRYDLTLLMRPDIPWEEEPQRTYRDNREEIYQLFKKTLDQFEYKYVEIDGTGETRIANGAQQIHLLLERREFNKDCMYQWLHLANE